MKSNREVSRRELLGQVLSIGAASVLAPQRMPAAEKPATGWRIGCYTRPWAEYEYPVALDAIAEAGFKHVGLMTAKSATNLVISAKTTVEEARKAGEECKKRSLTIPSLYGGDIPVSTSLAAGIEGLQHLIDNCVAAGIENLLMGGVTNPKLQEPYYKAITECCDYAAAKGIGISIKPHGGTNSTGPECRKLIESVGHKNFRLWYDPGNIFYYSDGKLDPVDDAATVDGLVVGMSVKDFRMPKEVALTPGTGMVNFPKVMARLKQGGFNNSPLIIECLAPGDLQYRLDEARKARVFVENLVAGLA